MLKHGGNSNLSLGVSGGSDALTYSVTGSYDNEAGNTLAFPKSRRQRFETMHGTEPEDWMRRPQQLRRWSAIEPPHGDPRA